MDDGEGLDEVGPWSEIKLSIIRDYLPAYSKIVGKRFHHLYIDGFAGAGAHVSRTTRSRIDGSPALALAAVPLFAEYHFIDIKRRRVRQLRALAAGRTNVHVHRGDCNEILLRDVFPKAQFQDRRRALCLLDPYGMQLAWEVVATAGRMGSIELFVNFPIGGINRNVLRHNRAKVNPDTAAKLTRVWGDESWRTAAYSASRGFFGVVHEKRTNAAIVDAYAERLRTVARFRYVPKPVAMLNRRGATVYYLFFASPHPIGNKIVESIFDKARREIARWQ